MKCKLNRCMPQPGQLSLNYPCRLVCHVSVSRRSDAFKYERDMSH